MLCHGDHILGSRFPEKLCPRGRIEAFRTEQGDKVLVAEVLVGAVGFHVVLEFRRALEIHVPGIPLAAEGRDGIDAPVDKNAEFCLGKPFRRRVGKQAVPIVPVGTCGDDLVDLLHCPVHTLIPLCFKYRAKHLCRGRTHCVFPFSLPRPPVRSVPRPSAGSGWRTGLFHR